MTTPAPSSITINGREFSLARQVWIMGIVNVTPDSFSDGGQWMEPRQAIEQGLRLVDEGSAILDIGGESTRPGAAPVSEEEELRRVIPVIAGIRARSDIPISVDTQRVRVAKEACMAGAGLINDVSAGRREPAMASLAARLQVPVCLMHSRGDSATMMSMTSYGDLIEDIRDEWMDAAGRFIAAGVRREDILMDPGIGFAKTPGQNLELVKSFQRFAALGFGLLAGPSRKSFIGAALGGAPPARRLHGTLAAVTALVLNGAHFIRAHDVAPCREAARVALCIREGELA